MTLEAWFVWGILLLEVLIWAALACIFVFCEFGDGDRR